MAQSPRFALSPRLCLFAILATLLAACSFQPPIVTAVESQASATLAPAPITLTLWHTVSPEQEATLQAIAKGWSRQQAVPVTIELRSIAGAESMHQTLLAAIQTQQTPDFAFIRPSDLHIYAEADELLPLTAYQDRLDDTDYIESFLQSNECAVGEKVGLWAMPIHRYQTMLYVNTTQLRESLGFETALTTWEAFEADCGAHLAQGQYACLSLVPTSEAATLLFLSHDNSIMEPTSAQPLLAEPSALATLQQLNRLQASQAVQVNPSYDGAVLDFVEGRTLFAVDSSAEWEAYDGTIEDAFEWEMVPFPSNGGTPRTLAYGGNLALFRSSAERETLALSFLDYFTGTEVNARWAEAMNALPVRHSAVEWLTTKHDDVHLQQVATSLPDAHTVPCMPRWNIVETQITQLVTDTLNGVAPPETLLSSAVQTANNMR